MGKAVIFVRVSTEKQQLESQEDALVKHALLDGFKEPNIIYIGKKESGYTLGETEREGLEELYQLIEQDKIDTVYIWELSRLSRKPKILYSIRDKFLENKIQLKCLKPQFTLLSADRTHFDNTANIIFSLFGALAEQEVIEKKERFARGKRRLAEEGRYNGGAIPFGYKIDKERNNLIIINEEEATIVREIYNLYENGLSQTAIAKEFYARDMKQFTISFIHQILTNKLLTGIKTKSKGASYERRYPQIITTKQFELCRKIATENNKTISKAKNIYYSDKLIKCPQCGGYWSSSGSKCLYRCYRANYINKDYNGYDGITLCTNKTNISINIIDSLLWHLAQILETEYALKFAQKDIEKLKRKKEDLTQKLSNIGNILKKLDEKKERLRVMYVDGMSKEAYSKKKKEIDDEELQIKNNENEYKHEITHIENLIQHKLAEYNFSNDDERADYIANNICDILDNTENVVNDKVRYNIIHKHIKEVSIEDSSIMYKFNCYKEPKETKARRITIQTYIGSDFNYIFVPFDGKGGSIFNCDSNFNIINKENINYLRRFVDVTKIKKREQEKDERDKLRIAKDEERKAKGLLTFSEAAVVSKIGYATLWYAAKNGKLPYTVIERVKYLNINDINNFEKIRRKSPSSTT